jgi:hypothetical protein
MVKHKHERPHRGFTSLNPTTIKIPQPPPSHSFTPMEHTTANKNNLHNTRRNYNRHRSSQPTGLPTHNPNTTTHYPSPRTCPEKLRNTILVSIRRTTDGNRIYTSQYPKRQATPPHKTVAKPTYHSRRLPPCGSGAK